MSLHTNIRRGAAVPARVCVGERGACARRGGHHELQGSYVYGTSRNSVEERGCKRISLCKKQPVLSRARLSDCPSLHTELRDVGHIAASARAYPHACWFASCVSLVAPVRNEEESSEHLEQLLNIKRAEHAGQHPVAAPKCSPGHDSISSRQDKQSIYSSIKLFKNTNTTDTYTVTLSHSHNANISKSAWLTKCTACANGHVQAGGESARAERKRENAVTNKRRREREREAIAGETERASESERNRESERGREEERARAREREGAGGRDGENRFFSNQNIINIVARRDRGGSPLGT